MDSQSSVDEGSCTVCHEGIELFAVGHCDHPICYKCSTKMRILCDQYYCAICRADMPKVLFVKTLKKFDSFKLDSFCIFREKGFFFESEDIKSAFEKLLENRCYICKENFNSFKELETHLRRVHERHFCDLCVDNLKLFSCDRKFYDRNKLAEHRRHGDADDKSYRQHPLCKFCDKRYFDNDELLRHLRKDHFFCHFCESDGLTNEYFQEYSFLQNHFREKHFLCEQDGCANVEFVNAFKTKIDLKAHISKFHGSNLGRQQARQLRAIEVDFNYGPRPNATGRRPYDRQRGGRGGASGFEERQGGRNQLRRNENHGHPDDQEKRLDTDAALALSLSLAEAQRQGSVCLVDPRLAQHSLMTQGAEAEGKTEKTDFKAVSGDFPILHGKEKPATDAATGGKEPRVGNLDTMAKILALGVGHSVGSSRLNETEFPQLGGGKSSGARKASGVWNNSGSLPETSSRSSMAEKAPGRVLKNNVKPDSFSISGAMANFGNEWTSVGSLSKSSSATRPSSGLHTSRTDPNLGDFPILGKPSNDFGASWVKNKEVKLPDQPQAKKKQEGFIKLATKKKAERHSDGEEAAMQDTTGINGRGVNELGGENGSGRKEVVKSLADIASLLTGSQTESKAANDEALPADSSGSDKKSRKKNNDNFVKNDRELSATKKGANQEDGKADNRTKKESLKQNVTLRDKNDHREEKKDKNLRQEDAANRKRSKNKGNEKNSTTNLRESQLDKKLSDETSSGDVVSKKKPETEFGVHSLPTTTDVGTSVLLSEPTDSELDKYDGFKTGKPEDVQTDGPNDISNLPVIDADFSMASKESCIEYNDVVDDEPKFLPSDFPRLVPNSAGTFSTGYNSNPLPESYPFGQIDIMPDVAVNSLLVCEDIPRSLDPGLSVVRDAPSDVAGLSLPTPPPGFTVAASKPPPGFAPMVVKPPPGFSQPSITAEPDKLANDTLSNFRNQYSTVPKYKPPKQFSERVAKFAEILRESTGNSFAQFSRLSEEFQGNLITARDYYRKCCELMDSSAFRRVFPELVALMPSIERQQELMKVHGLHLSEESTDIRKGWKPWNCPTDGLIPCQYCGQIILNDDSLEHLMEHDSSDFPMLK